MSKRYRVTVRQEATFIVDESDLEDGEAGPDGELTEEELDEQISAKAEWECSCADLEIEWHEVKA